MDAMTPHKAQEMMTPEQARARVIQINSGINNIRALLLDFHDREGWKALGYASWRECVTAEFGQSKTHLYRQLEAARIEQRINEEENSPMGEKSESTMGEKEPADEDVPFPTPEPIPERVLRPLSAIPPEDQPTVYQLAKETAPDGRLTAAHVEKTVREVKGEKPKKGSRERPEPTGAVFLGGNPADHVQRIINLIDQITDDNPRCKEALKRIAVHVWNRQHRREAVNS